MARGPATAHARRPRIAGARPVGTPRPYAGAVPSPLTLAVRDALSALGDPDRAAQQQRYMKSTMPFHGVGNPQRRAALRPVWAAHPLSGTDDWRGAIAELWDTAERREERYAATDLLRLPRYRVWASQPDPAMLALLRHLITTGAWWDHVDELASRPLGDLLRGHPDVVTPVLRGWAHEDDLWLRRSAIIAQLFSRHATDLELLSEAIEASITDRDFFARKAIGWALRQHARTDEAWVRAFVATHPDLSPLSRREALLHLDG